MKWKNLKHCSICLTCFMRFVLVFSVVLSLTLSPLAKVNSYCSETSSGANDTWSMNAGTFLELVWAGFAKEVSAPFVVWNELNGCTYDGFNTWLQGQDNGEHYHLLDDGTVVGHGGAGYSRDIDKINNSEEVNVNPELTQFVLNYIQYCTTQTDLGYKECYLYSYNFLSPSAFSTYAQYITTKEYLKNGGNKYSVILVSQGNIMISQYLNQDQNLGFVGTTNNGSFVSVQPYVNWQTLGQNMLQPNATVNTAGVMSQNVNTNWYGYNNLKNTATPNSSAKIIMSPNEKNELVYVFATLNAYKNYNAGMPQPYYLTSSGMNTGTWTASGGGVINTGSMNNSGNYYSSVTNGVGSNWTPDQIIELVDTVVNNSGGNGSGGSGSSENPFGFLGKLGEIIGQLVGGVGDLLTGIVDGIANVFLGTPDENGVRQGGLFSIVRSVINGIVELIDTDFVEFFNVVFDWLPQEIITLMVAGLTFALFFGILKMIRG